MRSIRRPASRDVACLPVTKRAGATMLDYVLVIGAILPMAAMSYYYSVRIIRAVYEMTCTLVCWPFM